MSIRRVGLYLILAIPLFMLMSALFASEPLAGKRVADWSDQQLRFVADSRMGRVQSFRLGHGAPVFCAQTEISPRRWALDVQVDAQRGQVWVLGDDGLSIHDAHDLRLVRRISLANSNAVALRVEAERVVLVGGSGESLGQIELGRVVADAQPTVGRG